MVGETVRHIRFGKGIIIKEENGKIHVKFNEGKKNSHMLLLKNMSPVIIRKHKNLSWKRQQLLKQNPKRKVQ